MKPPDPQPGLNRLVHAKYAAVEIVHRAQCRRVRLLDALSAKALRPDAGAVSRGKARVAQQHAVVACVGERRNAGEGIVGHVARNIAGRRKSVAADRCVIGETARHERRDRARHVDHVAIGIRERGRIENGDGVAVDDVRRATGDVDDRASVGEAAATTEIAKRQNRRDVMSAQNINHRSRPGNENVAIKGNRSNDTRARQDV